MNNIEREIYDKYAYKKTNIYLVYEEFERRVNSTGSEYEGLKIGECRFDYVSWEKRLGLSHKVMVNSIKILIKDGYIEQKVKGRKGIQSKYFLTRFLEQNLEQKNEQNSEQNKPSKINGLGDVEEQNSEQNLEQKRIQSSIYNNLNIKSNNIYSSNDIEELWKLYPRKTDKKKAFEKIKKLLSKYSKEELVRCIQRYSKEVQGTDKKFILMGSTFFNGRYADYLDSNYNDIKPKEVKSNVDYVDEIMKEMYERGEF